MNLPVLRYRKELRLGKSHNIFITSDLHIGAIDFNEKGFHKVMSSIYDKCDKILILGDVFDAIFSKDKRYTPSVTSLAGIDDQLNGAIDMAFNILKPYANKIQLISKGNHEVAILKYVNVDILSMLIYRLNHETGSTIQMGSYRGYVQHVFTTANKNVRYYNLLYDHGHGGSSMVTKGMIDINRIKTGMSFDGFFFGHKHNKIADIDNQISLSRTGKILTKKRISAQVGTFKNLIFDSKTVGWEDTKGFDNPVNGGIMLTITTKLQDSDYYLDQSITL